MNAAGQPSTDGPGRSEPTWSNFAENYDAQVAGSFLSQGGWVSADVAGLVSDWVDGTWPNYGLMLISPSQAGDRYLSSEYSDVDRRPWLEVCYIAPYLAQRLLSDQD